MGKRCGEVTSERTKGPILASLLSLLFVAIAAAAPAADRPRNADSAADLAELELEELVELDVFAVDVLGEHIHPPGQWSVAYRYSLTRYAGYRDGSKDVSAGEVTCGDGNACTFLPTDLTAETHSAQILYAPRSDFTLGATFPYVRLSMDHVEPERFTTTSEGLGDVKLEAHYTLFGDIAARHRLVLDAALSFPTGSIDEEDLHPPPPDGLPLPLPDGQAPARRKLPYSMQLGSGTLDLLPGLTYHGQLENWAFLLQAAGTVRLGENANDYSLGNRFRFTAQAARKITDWLSLFAGIDEQVWGNVDGVDAEIEAQANENPAARADRQGGERIDLLFGLGLYVPEGALKGHRLEIEAGLPLSQSLDGPQLETDWRLGVTWRWDFFL